MLYNDRNIESVAQMIAALKQQREPKQVVWFRGQSKKNWKLVPSLARKQNNLKAESALIKRFMQDAVPHIDPPPREEWEWMFLMQHHRAYTRLLDWSESPLTALFFAVEEKKHKKVDGAVWCLDPVALNRAANLQFAFEPEIPAFGRDKVLDSYLPSRVQESPAKQFTVAIVGPRNTPRMAAQLGTFTINHRLHTPIETIGNHDHVWRWIIPAAAKKRIQEELTLLGVSVLTLFPELDRVAEVSMDILK
jgi:hypothetical protein